jgi:hypothetical protein
VLTIRLIYSSAAAVGMSYGALSDIMTHAQDSNPARGITGMLCYGSGQFLQALEGDRAAVNALYHRIATDNRHTACQLISVEEIAERDFAEWSMKVVNWEDGDTARRRALLQSDTGSTVFDPGAMTSGQATAFLRHLADLERELAGD